MPGYNAYSPNYWLLFLPHFLLENGFLSHFSLNRLFPCKLFSKEYSGKRASVIPQKVKNPLPMQDIWVKSLDQEDPVRREWLPTPVFLPEESHGQRILAGYSPWGRKESDTTEQLSAHTHTHILLRLWICQPVKKWERHQTDLSLRLKSVPRNMGAFCLSGSPGALFWATCSSPWLLFHFTSAISQMNSPAQESTRNSTLDIHSETTLAPFTHFKQAPAA